jgi:hypothetical protein
MWKLRWSLIPHRSLQSDFSEALASHLPSQFPRDLLPLVYSFQCTALRVKHYTAVSYWSTTDQGDQPVWLISEHNYLSRAHGEHQDPLVKTHCWYLNSYGDPTSYHQFSYSVSLDEVKFRADPHHPSNAWLFKRQRTH